MHLSPLMTMILNVILLVLAIYLFIRLFQRRAKNRPKHKNEMDIANDKLTAMSDELKELDVRLKRERAERD